MQPRTIEVADYLLNNDRDLAKKMLTQNKTGQELCGWHTDSDGD